MNDAPEVVLQAPASIDEWMLAAHILEEYGASLRIDLSFQDFPGEVRDPSLVYGPDGARLLLAWVDGAVAGCGALRPLADAPDANACEMKRLYVRPAFRRFGLGRALAGALMAAAVEQGYSVMYLDTLSDMAAARELYDSLGFEPTDPYYYNPVPGAHYFRADLSGGVSRY